MAEHNTVLRWARKTCLRLSPLPTWSYAKSPCKQKLLVFLDSSRPMILQAGLKPFIFQNTVPPSKKMHIKLNWLVLAFNPSFVLRNSWVYICIGVHGNLQIWKYGSAVYILNKIYRREISAHLRYDF